VFFVRSQGIGLNPDATASKAIPREARELREAPVECFAAARGEQPTRKANDIIGPPT